MRVERTNERRESRISRKGPSVDLIVGGPVVTLKTGLECPNNKEKSNFS